MIIAYHFARRDYDLIKQTWRVPQHYITFVIIMEWCNMIMISIKRLINDTVFVIA